MTQVFLVWQSIGEEWLNLNRGKGFPQVWPENSLRNLSRPPAQGKSQSSAKAVFERDFQLYFETQLLKLNWLQVSEIGCVLTIEPYSVKWMFI